MKLIGSQKASLLASAEPLPAALIAVIWVYDRYWRGMYSLEFHYTQDHELAKEIVQMVFESL